MKGWIIVVVTVFLLVMPVRAMEYAPELERFWGQAEEYGVSSEESLEEGINRLLTGVPELLRDFLSSGIRSGIKVLAVVLLCALGEGLCFRGGKEGFSAVRLAGALSITALTMTDVVSMIGLGRSTIEKMDAFAGVLLPGMAILSAVGGGIRGSAVRQGATVLCSKMLVSLMDRLLVPMVYAYVVVSCARAVSGNPGLEKLGQILKSAVTGLLTGLLVLFVGYLTAGGAVAGSVDASKVRAAKMAISRAIPVVGGILADASETVLAGTGVLKGAVGGAGMLVVLAICISPFLHLASQYLIYKGTAALCGCVAQPELSRLIDAIGSAFGLILGMAGASALILLVSVVSAILAVTG